MSYTRLFYHITWSTKIRLPLITSELESNLFNYLHKKASDMECRILAVNGWQDHIHLIIEFPPNISVAHAVKRLKGASSHEFDELVWQRGYGAMTVSERNLHAAIKYVNNQKEHHRQQTAVPKFERSDDEDEDEVTTGIREDSDVYAVDTQELF
jgi:putative transposase